MVKHLSNSILEIFKDQNLLKGSLPRALRQIAGRVLDLGKNFEIYQNFETGSEDSSFFDWLHSVASVRFLFSDIL